MTAIAPSAAPAVVRTRQRFGPGLLRTIVRNPLDALPPEIFDHAMVTGWGPIGNALHIADPGLIQDVLAGRAELFGKTKANRRVLEPTLGEGLLVSEGVEWRWQRRAAAPVFQPAQLAGLAPAMLAAARATRDRWLSQPGATLRLDGEMMRTTFAIILDTMLSDSPAIDATLFERAMADTLEPAGWSLATVLLGLPAWTPYPGRRRAENATRYLRGTTHRLVVDHRARHDPAPDLLSLLEAAVDPDTGRRLGDTQLVDNLLTFIAAGHETTALALAWTFHLLAAHPAVEDEARAEIDRVVGTAEVAPAHLGRLPYLRQVVSEALRLYPPAPLLSRSPSEATELGGVALKRGSVVTIPVYALHRHRLLWDEPERFDPGRFAPAAAARRHRYAFLPFGGGPHVCIGSAFALTEAVAVLAVLLQRLCLRSLADVPPPRAVMRVTLKPVPGIRMRVDPRRS